MTSDEDRLGVRLRQEREQRGWTQAQVAERLAGEGIHLHTSAIAKMEDRKSKRPRMIRLDEASALARIFGKSVDEMLAPTSASIREVAQAAEEINLRCEFLEQNIREFLERLQKLAQLNEIRNLESTPEVDIYRKKIDDALNNIERRSTGAESINVTVNDSIHGLSQMRHIRATLTKQQEQQVKQSIESNNIARAQSIIQRALIKELESKISDVKLGPRNDDFPHEKTRVEAEVTSRIQSLISQNKKGGSILDLDIDYLHQYTVHEVYDKLYGSIVEVLPECQNPNLIEDYLTPIIEGNPCSALAKHAYSCKRCRWKLLVAKTVAAKVKRMRTAAADAHVARVRVGELKGAERKARRAELKQTEYRKRMER